MKTGCKRRSSNATRGARPASELAQAELKCDRNVTYTEYRRKRVGVWEPVQRLTHRVACQYVWQGLMALTTVRVEQILGLAREHLPGSSLFWREYLKWAMKTRQEGTQVVEVVELCVFVLNLELTLCLCDIYNTCLMCLDLSMLDRFEVTYLFVPRIWTQYSLKTRESF